MSQTYKIELTDDEIVIIRLALACYDPESDEETEWCESATDKILAIGI